MVNYNIKWLLFSFDICIFALSVVEFTTDIATLMWYGSTARPTLWHYYDYHSMYYVIGSWKVF